MSQTIVIADESISIRKEMKDRLEREGYKVIEAADGDMALDYALEFRPCVVIAGAEMPVIDGWTLCANKHNYRELDDIPIILMGDFQKKSDRERAVDLKADDYVTKPLEMEEIVSRVSLLLKKTRSQEKRHDSKSDTEKASIRGQLSVMPLGDILQYLSNIKKTGILSIYPKQTINNGHIYFHKGNVIDAELDNLNMLNSVKALLRILSWQHGVFYFEEQNNSRRRTIFGNVFNILMESMRIHDELENLKKKLPPFDIPLYINFSKDFFKWGLLHSQVEQIELLALINKYQYLQEVMDHTEMDDLAIAQGTLHLINKGIITTQWKQK